jgi:hypothetical protein
MEALLDQQALFLLSRCENPANAEECNWIAGRLLFVVCDFRMETSRRWMIG